MCRGAAEGGTWTQKTRELRTGDGEDTRKENSLSACNKEPFGQTTAGWVALWDGASPLVLLIGQQKGRKWA